MGLSTLTGLKRQGFWIPYRYAHTLPDAGQREAYEPIERLFADHRAIFEAMLAKAEEFAADLQAIGTNDAALGPRWNQDWFPRLDAVVAYAMIRLAEPARVIEVGSGHSTRFMVRAIMDGGLVTRLRSIDPAPRAAIDGLGIEVVRRPLHRADSDIFRTLASGDVLFIDSSHIAMPGSDVDQLFNRVLPLLPPGVLVHIHDIFLPDDYPETWGWRGYNEQLAVVPLLTSGAWQPLFSSRYMTTRAPERIDASVAGRLPLPKGAFETSLWLVRR
ncbi:MAG: class I SAM-dependent methyltransferase [Rhodospirillales bacterium]|nr:class I SAM-dependent methyltransferase [Rhodospirillales bacterium]